MEPVSDPLSPRPKAIVPVPSFFQEWRGFAVGLAMLMAVLGGYICFVGIFSNARSSNRPESKAGFDTSKATSGPATAPAALNQRSGAP